MSLKILGSIFTIFSALTISCNKNDSVHSKEFYSYINQISGKVPIDGMYYILIPSNQCQNCITLDGKKLSPFLEKHIHIITAFPAKQFPNFSNIATDYDNKMLELTFLDYETKVIYYDKGEIVFIKPITLTRDSKDSSCKID